MLVGFVNQRFAFGRQRALGQIRASYASDALGTIEKLSYDLWYLRHRSLMLDLMICLKTLPRMSLFRGAR